MRLLALYLGLNVSLKDNQIPNITIVIDLYSNYKNIKMLTFYVDLQHVVLRPYKIF